MTKPDRTLCLAMEDYDYLCTLEAGHEGDHVATGEAGAAAIEAGEPLEARHIYRQWPQ